MLTYRSEGFAVTASMRDGKLIVDRREIRDGRLGDVEDTLVLPAPAVAIETENLEFNSSGTSFFVDAVSPHLQSFPHNQAAVHSVWIVNAKPLKLVRELSMPELTTTPYWVEDDILQFQSGDAQGNCVDYKIESDGAITKTVRKDRPPMPSREFASDAAKVLNSLGYKHPPMHPAGPTDFARSHFMRSTRNPDVSPDGTTIITDAWHRSWESDTGFADRVVLLTKEGADWETKLLEEEGHHKFVLASNWIAVGRHSEDGWECRIYDKDLDQVLGEFKADVFDLYSR